MEGVRDIPRLYTGIAEWLGCLTVLISCGRRIRGKAFVLTSILMLAAQCLFLILTDDVPANLLWIFCMAVAAGLMLLYIFSCGNLSLMQAGYCFAFAFMAAELAASFHWQLYMWSQSLWHIPSWGSALMLVPVFGLAFLLFYKLMSPKLQGDFLSHLTTKELFAVNMIALVTFLFSNMSFVVNRSPFSGKVIEDVFNIRTLVDMAGMAIAFAFQARIAELVAAREAAAMRLVLNSQYEQYKNYHESEVVLHMMQHDLKHQIEGLRAETDMQRRGEWLDAMQRELESWSLPPQTGNTVLDTMLAAKLRQARTLQIRITCVADGKLLSFMHVTDICTLFGNALDNAMESVVQISEAENRLIHVLVAAKKGFVFIQVSNTCETQILKDENGMLVSTKPEKTKHGYGMKGIRYAAEKYGGNVTYQIENGWFYLNILIPRETLN